MKFINSSNILQKCMFAMLPRTSYGTSWTCIKPANFVSWITDKASQMCNCDCNFAYTYNLDAKQSEWNNGNIQCYFDTIIHKWMNNKWLIHTCLPPQISNVHKHTTLGMFVGIKKDPACSTSNWWLIQLLHGTEQIYIRAAASQELVPSIHTGWNSVDIMGEKFLHTWSWNN